MRLAAIGLRLPAREASAVALEDLARCVFRATVLHEVFEVGISLRENARDRALDERAMAERLPIALDATAGDLHDQLARLGADLMVRALAAIERGSLTLTPQPAAGVTYAAKIENNETRIDWSEPCRRVHDHIRGLAPRPGAWFELAGTGRPTRVKVLRTTFGEGEGAPGMLLDNQFMVACGEGAVRVLELQRAGRQAMKADEFLRGTPIAPGTRLG